MAQWLWRQTFDSLGPLCLFIMQAASACFSNNSRGGIHVTQGKNPQWIPLWHFVLFDWLNSYIRTRLLLSGDVELNPGPGKKRSARNEKSKVPQQSTFSLSEYCIIPEPPASTSEAVDVPAGASEGEHAGIVATKPSSSKSLEDSHAAFVVSQSPASKSLQSRDIEKSTDSARTNSLSSSYSIPKTDYIKEYKQRKPYLMDTRRCISSELTRDDCLAIMMSSTLNSATDKTIPDEEREQYASKLEDGLERFLHALKVKEEWSEDRGFYESNPDLFLFFLLLNQIIEYRGTCKVCVLCGKMKADDQKTSPIFPSSLVDSFRKIHGEDAGRIVSMSNSRVSLFCSACESHTLCNETQLRDLYLTIMDPDNYDKQIKVENPEWLLHILATIMYRGIFLRNFFGELQNHFDQFVRVLASLRSYIINMNTYTRTTEVPPEILDKFGVYILPNGIFSMKNDQPNYCLSQHLRLPQLTSFVRTCTAERTFLYTQFDCFHCVLPYSRTPIPGLNLQTSCFTPDLIHQNSINVSAGETMTCEFILLNTSEKRKRLLPRALVKENQKRAVSHQMNSVLISQVALEQLPAREEPEHSLLLDPSGLPFAFVSDRPIHQFETISSEKQCLKIYQRAERESPFCGCEIEQQRVRVANVEQVKYIKQRCKELETEHSPDSCYRELQTEIDELRSRNKELEKNQSNQEEVMVENRELKKQVEALQSIVQQTEMCTTVAQPDQEGSGMYQSPLKPM